MYHDGLYISHGNDSRAVVIIREDEGRLLWIRDFVDVKSELDILNDDVLSSFDRNTLEQELAGKRGFYTNEVVRPEDDYSGCGFRRYQLT